MEGNTEEKNKREGNKKEKKLSVDEPKEKLKEFQRLASEYLAGWKRSRADLLNYKKEEMNRISEALKYANKELILKILSVLDTFDLAEKRLPANLNNNEHIKGIFQIRNQLQDLLKNQKVEEIKVLGEKFDPNFQEVIEEVAVKPFSSEASEGRDKESGLVIEEVQKGYLLHGKILRPAKVKVSK